MVVHSSAMGVAVTISGLMRSLLSLPVHASYRAHIWAGSDTFIVVVGKWNSSAAGHAETAENVRKAYTPVHLEMMEESPLELRCTPWNSHDSVSWRNEFGGRSCPKATAWRDEVLLQWIAVRRAYRHVEDHERRRGRAYRWLLRTRTDIVWLQPLPRLQQLEPRFAYVPRGGMNRAPFAMCTNDHLFLCPRHLCRAYFELLEIFESPHCAAPLLPSGGPVYDLTTCHRDASTGQYPQGATARKRRDGMSEWRAKAAEAPPLISATRSASGDLVMNGPPHDYASRHYSIPPVSPRLAPYAEQYFLARYTPAGTECVASDPGVSDACCGLIREVPFWYALARGGTLNGWVTCRYSLNETWRYVQPGAEAEAMAESRLRCDEAHRFLAGPPRHRGR